MGPGDDHSSRWAAAQASLMLEALRFNWGEAYKIDHADGRWTADRLDGVGRTLRAKSPEDLRQAIFRDYTAKPVPRDLPTGKLRQQP